MAGKLQQLERLSNALRYRFRAWARLLRPGAITASSALRLALSPAVGGGRSGPLESAQKAWPGCGPSTVAVNTSTPSSVISRVCSNWALR